MSKTLLLTWLWSIPLIIGLNLLLPKNVTNNLGWYAMCFVIGCVSYLITDKLVN